MNWRYGALLAGAVLVAGCSAGQSTNGTGTVQGTFEQAGGPAIVVNGKAETPVVPLAGIVTFTGAGGQKFSVNVGRSAVFSTRGPAAGSVLGCHANSKRSGTGFASSRLLATGSGSTRRAILRLRYVVRRANWPQSFSGWPTTV